MPLLGHGHYQGQADTFAYAAKCDGCSSVVRFTSSTDPASDLDDMDWIEDGHRLLCSGCNPKAPGNNTPIPNVFKAASSSAAQEES